MPKLKKEQLEAITFEQGNILVSASAGSGKTFVMIERLIRLVKEGKAQINEILAVTYTEAAASEMKEKLKNALRKSVAEGNYQLAPLISQVATADISTVHAFCGRLIRRYFFVAGVSPDFAIADESRANTIKQESLEKTFKQLYQNKESWFLQLIDKFSLDRSDKGLKEAVLDIYEHFSSESDPEKSIDDCLKYYTEQGFYASVKVYKDYFNQDLDRLIAKAESALQGFIQLDVKSGIEFCQGLIDDMKTMQESSLYGLFNYAEYKKGLTFGRIPENSKVYKDIAVKAKTDLETLIPNFLKHLQSEEKDKEDYKDLYTDTANLSSIVKLFGENYAKEKLEENLLDFSDLEHFALKVLQDPNVQESVRQQYKYIFIDEYQDVNATQEEIINCISNDNTFMVGDVKQSIYGFRGCRADFFSNKLKEMPLRGEKTLKLNYNFRSANAVLDMVNQIFSYCMTKERYGSDYHDSLLVAGGLYPENAVGRAQVHSLIPKKKEKAQKESLEVYDILKDLKEPEDKEVSRVASLVVDIINEELGKTFYDPKLEKDRIITFGDVCILTRSRENLYVAKLVEGLIRHGVPVMSSVAQNVCKAPEIQVLINVLKLIDCFNGDIPLASTLKSVIGGFTDEELADIVLYYTDNLDKIGQKSKGTFYDAYEFYISSANTDLAKRLKEFNDYFAKIRELADFLGAHDILNKVILDSGYLATLYARRLGEQKVKRVRKFLSEAIVSQRKLTVKEFLSLIENTPKAFDMSEIAEEDVVKVMTMHSSKGLEFPVVIVCGLEQALQPRHHDKPYQLDRDLGFAIKHFDSKNRTSSETLLRGIIKEKTKDNNVKEELRLFYVATTRPTYSLHLVVNGKFTPSKSEFIDAKSYKDFIPATIPVTEHEEESLNGLRERGESSTIMLGEPDKDALERIKANTSFSYPYLADTHLPLKTSVTKELASLSEQTSFAYYVFENEDTTDKERGIVAHKIMEHYDFSSDSGISEQVKVMVNNGVLTAEQVETVNLSRIQTAFDQGAFKGIKGDKLFCEKNFIASIEPTLLGKTDSKENIVVQGIIDLLAIGKDGAKIIDYKYSTLTPKGLKDKYEKQLLVYARAVALSTNIPVVKTTIVNLFTGDVIDL